MKEAAALFVRLFPQIFRKCMNVPLHSVCCTDSGLCFSMDAFFFLTSFHHNSFSRYFQNITFITAINGVLFVCGHWIFQVTGRESLTAERASRPVKIAESDADVSESFCPPRPPKKNKKLRDTKLVSCLPLILRSLFWSSYNPPQRRS